jgi:hypothetical protein
MMDAGAVMFMGEFGAVVLLEVSTHGAGGGSVVPALYVSVLGLDGHTMQTHASRDNEYSYYSLPDVTSSELLRLPPMPVSLSRRLQDKLMSVIASGRAAAQEDKRERRATGLDIGFQKTPAFLRAALVLAAERALDKDDGEDPEIHAATDTSYTDDEDNEEDTNEEDTDEEDGELHAARDAEAPVDASVSPASAHPVREALCQQREYLERSAASPTVSGLVDTMQRDALLQALHSARSHPSGGLTDVGLHTGSTPCPTAAPLAEALFFHTLQGVQTEQVGQQRPTQDAAAVSLPVFADRDAAWGLTAAGRQHVSPSSGTCSRDYHRCSGDPETCTGDARVCRAGSKDIFSALVILRNLHQAEGLLQLRKGPSRLVDFPTDGPHAGVSPSERDDLPGSPLESDSGRQRTPIITFPPDGDGLAAGIEAVHWLLSTASRAADTLLTHSMEESALRLFLCSHIIPRCESVYEALKHEVNARYEEAAAQLTLAQLVPETFTEELSTVGQPISVPPGTLPEALHFAPLADDEVRQRVRHNLGGVPLVGMGAPGQPKCGLALGLCLGDWAKALVPGGPGGQMQTAVVVIQAIDGYLWSECKRLDNDALWHDIKVGCKLLWWLGPLSI